MPSKPTFQFHAEQENIMPLHVKHSLQDCSHIYVCVTNTIWTQQPHQNHTICSSNTYVTIKSDQGKSDCCPCKVWKIIYKDSFSQLTVLKNPQMLVFARSRNLSFVSLLLPDQYLKSTDVWSWQSYNVLQSYKVWIWSDENLSSEHNLLFILLRKVKQPVMFTWWVREPIRLKNLVTVTKTGMQVAQWSYHHPKIERPCFQTSLPERSQHWSFCSVWPHGQTHKFVMIFHASVLSFISS